MSGPTEFVGEFHRSTAQGLAARCSQVDGGSGESYVYLLEGATGVGKSRIIREVYEILRESLHDASAPAYWPPLPPEQSGSETGLGFLAMNRKILGPDVSSMQWLPNVLPTFAWWSIRCEPKGVAGSGFHASLESQLKAHGRPLEAARRAGLGTGAKVVETVAPTAKDIAAIGADEAMGYVWGLIPIPFVSQIADAMLSIGRTALKLRRDRTALSRMQDVGLEVQVSAKSRSTQLAEEIGRLATPRTPAVVVVEDAHLLDEPTRVFLEGLQTDPAHPVIVLATAWKVQHTQDFDLWVGGTARLKRIAVESPPPRDLANLIGARTQFELPADDAIQVATTLRTPLAVTTFLGLGRVRSILGHRPLLSAAGQELRAIAENDTSIEQLLDLGWRELPRHMQHALAFGALSSSGGDPLAGYSPPVVLDAVQAAFQPVPNQMAGLATGFDEAVRANWTVHTEVTDYFREPSVAALVRRRAQEALALPIDAVQHFRGEVATAGAARIDSIGEATPEAQVHAGAAAHSLIGSIPRDELSKTRAGAAAVLTMAMESLQANDFGAALNWLILLADEGAVECPEVLAGNLQLCEILLDRPTLHDVGKPFINVSRLLEGQSAIERDVLERAIFVLTCYQLDLDLHRFSLSLAERGVTTNITETPEYQVVVSEFAELLSRVRSLEANQLQSEVDLSVRFADALAAHNARPAAVDLLLGVYGRVQPEVAPTDEVLLTLTADLLGLAGGSGSSTQLLPIAERFAAAMSEVHGRFSSHGITASTFYSRWLIHSTKSNRDKGFELAKVNSEVARSEYGVGSIQSIDAHTVLFTCLRHRSLGDRDEEAAVAVRLDEFCDAASAAVGGNKGMQRYIDWMRKNLAYRSVAEHFDEVLDVELNILDPDPLPTVERKVRSESAVSNYSDFLRRLPLPASHNVKRRGTKNKNVFVQHAEEYGLDIDEL
ncbi:hypothetical protein ABLE94_20115 [Gordonia sp. VNK1]|uniref:hypothetical protein n=1 Tax=Gordonia oleivorans TaxID=3156618 RepID=UPI0032B3993D